MNDIGPRPNAFDIEAATLQNETYRTVAWTGKYMQVTLMTIPIGQSIGLESHPATDPAQAPGGHADQHAARSGG